MINQRLVGSALEAVDTTNFERFAQTFYGAIQDREFVPLGGVHDGGAEGFDAPNLDEPELFCDDTASNFLQVSKQESSRKKIRDTVKRLRNYGRVPKVLTYITSRVVADIDKEEHDLTQELKCKIAIRDARYIEVYINSSEATQGAFVSFLQPSIMHLFSPGVSSVGSETEKYVDRTLAVFLRQEVDSRRSKNGLMESVSDSLILWALRNTDPDPSKNQLMSQAQILQKIEEALPTAKAFIRGVLDHRLAALCSKSAPGGRQIRFYRKTNEFCLPFETRITVAAENAEDEILKTNVSNIFIDRLRSGTNEDISLIQDSVVSICHQSLERVFEHQGLKLAQFIENSTEDDELYTDVAAITTSIVDQLPSSPEIKLSIRRHALFVLRGTFYKSSEAERIYLGKLSKTYILMLLLKNEPRIVEYFSSLAGSFTLYVGTDIIVRALSEIFLDDECQTTINLLKILKSSGSTLVLTEKTLEEIATHIRRQIFEFENFYEAVESKISIDLVEYIDRLMIRAYFYSKLDPVNPAKYPKNWRSYISQFCKYGDVRNNKGDEELADYLIRKFDFIFETEKDMIKGIDLDELRELSIRIQKVKEAGGRERVSGDILAYNDALQVLRVYSRRIENGENNLGNPFGYQTWWLTQDGKVRRGSAQTIASRGGKFFMMRPEFLLNYISLSPSLEEVRKSYRSVFPSSLGVRLSSGIRSEDFKKVMRDASDVMDVDDARAGAMITALTNKLKGDAVKIFDNKW